MTTAAESTHHFYIDVRLRSLPGRQQKYNLKCCDEPHEQKKLLTFYCYFFFSADAGDIRFPQKKMIRPGRG
jgi:hypothetical protein